MVVKIQRVDTRTEPRRAHEQLAELRRKLSPTGEMVSEASRERTIAVFGAPLSPQQVVERICGEVRQDGAAAVQRYSQLLDRADVSPQTLRVSPQALQQAHEQADPAFIDAVCRIRDNVHEFQSAVLPRDVRVERPGGVILRQRHVPLDRVGICVPGGAAAYPSTVLMTVVPAQAAGVRQIAVVAPPTRFGADNLDLLATCQELGVEEVYRVGGAQAVAALAYGIEGLPSVDKVVGPGNLFVALAKKHVYGTVDIDSIAGPSEVVVIADERAPATYLAADLLAQAEHSPGSSILISWSDDVLDKTLVELERQLGRLDRAALTVPSLEQYGAMVRVADAAEACQLANWLAPEHLHIATADPEPLGEQIRHAGATFLGYYSPVAVGDYAAGPSHVLPTGGTARWASGLSSVDFLRRGSVIQYTREALASVAPLVRRLADMEGLTAHRASVDVRLDDVPQESDR